MRHLLPLRIAESGLTRLLHSSSGFSSRLSPELPSGLSQPTSPLRYTSTPDNRHIFTTCLTRPFTTETRSRHQSTPTVMNGSSPTSRSKRKAPFSPDEHGRLHKHLRPANRKLSPSENTPDTELPSFMESDMATDEELAPYPPQAVPDTAEWQATIEKVVRNVVSIRFCQTCSFDTDAACASEATGFVVDAEKG